MAGADLLKFAGFPVKNGILFMLRTGGNQIWDVVKDSM